MAQWMTGAVFFATAGVLYNLGQEGLALIAGWTGGFVLIAVLFAPYLHKSGAVTVPDFLGRRFAGVMPRALGVLVLLVVSGGLLIAQFQIAGTVLSRAAGTALPALGHEEGVWLAAAVVLFSAFPGGMRSVSWVQIAQGALILAGILVPAALVSLALTGTPVPQLTLGEVHGLAGNAEAALGLPGTGGAGAGVLGAGGGVAGTVALALSVMLGTAALPALLQRMLAARRVSGARSSAVWAMLFAVLILITLPAYAVFARFELLDVFAQAGGGMAAEALPRWLLGWSEGVLTICGVAPADAAAVAAACGGGVSYADIAFSPEFLVLALPEMAGLGPFATVLLVVAGFGAALSTAGGLAVTLGASLSHDLGHRLLDTAMAPSHRVALARLMLVLVVLGAAFLAAGRGGGVAQVAGASLSLAAGGLFAALLLGIWDRRTTGPAAAAGIVTGFGVSLIWLAAATVGGDMAPGSGDEISPFGLGAGAAGLLGAVAGLLVTWLVSRLTPPPDAATEDFIDEMRVARDHAIASID